MGNLVKFVKLVSSHIHDLQIISQHLFMNIFVTR